MNFYAQHDLRNSFYDGMLANMFATLTGGVFLTGFALYLGMNEFLIGLLASIPFLVTVFQLPAAYLISQNGRRKKVAFWCAALARVFWIPILVVALLPFTSSYTRILIIVFLIFIAYSFASVSYIAWLSWISEIVSDQILGRFFGTRNMLNGAAGIVAMLAFGYLLDYSNRHLHWSVPIGFCITFASAVFLGLAGLRFLNRISEPSVKRSASYTPLKEYLSLPFENDNFKRFLAFSFLWRFSVNFASPFFTLYYLRELDFSYGFVATLGMISILADLAGMHLWGKISDRVKNKAVIQFASWVAILLPAAWVLVRPESMLLPIILHILGGGFWAGINLCTNNLLLRISPRENRAMFLSAFNIVGGLSAAVAPILAGMMLSCTGNLVFEISSLSLCPLHIVFLISTSLRFLSFQLFKNIREPEEADVGELIRVLRSVRGLNLTNGFSTFLHPFVEVSDKKSSNDCRFLRTQKSR